MNGYGVRRYIRYFEVSAIGTRHRHTHTGISVTCLNPASKRTFDRQLRTMLHGISPTKVYHTQARFRT